MGLMVSLFVTFGPIRSSALTVRAAATQVVQGLRSARARAIASNRAVTFVLDLDGHSFRVGETPPQPLPTTLHLTMLTIAGKADRSHDTGAISFAPDGSSSGGQIEMADNGNRLIVGVDWLTGRVSVADAR